MAEFAPPTLASETIFHIGDFAVRNTLLMAWLAMLALFTVAFFTRATGYKKVPGRFQTLMEMGVEGLYNFYGSVIQDAKQTRMFFPLLATILIFVVTGNWMGIFPGVGSVFIEGMHDGHVMDIPLFRSMNADVNMTLAIALISMIAVQGFGIALLGFKSYSGKFFIAPWKNPVGTFVGLLELIGEFSKVVSFTFRLFGNIFAGEVLLVVISYLVPYVAPIPFLALEVFVGLVQGLVFSLLTAVFLKIGATGHGEEEHMEPAH